MTNTKPHWSQTELADIIAKSQGLFLTLTGLTSTPREAAEIICMMHMLLFLNYGDGTTAVDTMLADYVKNFRSNYDLQVAEDRRHMN